MRSRVLILLVLVAHGGVGCSDDPDDSGTGTPRTPASMPVIESDDVSPVITAVRAGPGWRLTVTMPLAESKDLWIRSIRLLDGKRELGRVDRDGPAPGVAGEALPVVAAFDVPIDAEAVSAEIVDSNGRTHRTAWKSS